MKLSTRETAALIAARTPQTANEMTAALRLAVPRRFDGARVDRHNVARIPVRDRVMKFGAAGEADLRGQVPIMAYRSNGEACKYSVVLWIEIKAGRDRLSEKQRAFRDYTLRNGGIWVECRDVEACLTEIERQVEGKR